MKYLLTIFLLAFSTFGYSNPVPDFPFIILTERLEKRVKPDVVKVSFGLTAFSSTSAESLESLRSAGKSVISLLEKYEIPLNLLESTQINKRTKRASRDDTYNLEILGYETTQDFKLSLSDLTKYPTLMNELIAIDGVTKIYAIFESTQEKKYKAEMIQELSNNARKKADTLAEAQSKTVKQVYGITTEGNFGDAFSIFSLQSESGIYAAASTSDPGYYRKDLTMMAPEYIVVNQRITAIYELK